jgi:hypothetical protein
MSFKKFGGLNYSAKSNIISNHYSNSGNLGITDTLGQPNSKIVSQSHIDMSANSIMNIGSLYFMDGTMQTTALETNPSGTAIFNHGILVFNGTTTDTLHVTDASQLDGNVTVTTGDLTVTVGDLTVTGLSSLNGGITVNDGNNDVFTVGTNGDTTIGPSGGTSQNALTINGDLTVSSQNSANLVLTNTTGTITITTLTNTGVSQGSTSTTWASIIAGGGGGATNSITINPSQSAPCPSAGISNPFNTGGYASQYFSNVSYAYINIWVDFQTFHATSSYQDSMMVQVDIVWDGNDASPSAYYGNCNFLCKLFPKRIYTSGLWGTHYQGVAANTNNVYTGLASYNSTNSSYAPYGRQYWCYNIQGSQYCSVYGGASYCLFQFPNPTTSNYCCSASIRVLDSSVVQTNTQVPSANSGVKVYINYQATIV